MSRDISRGHGKTHCDAAERLCRCGVPVDGIARRGVHAATLKHALPEKRHGWDKGSSRQRCSGAKCLIRSTKAPMSSRLWERCTRRVDDGRLASDTPGLHSFTGRRGRGTNPPPQLGQTLCKMVSTQSAQNVHSKLHIRAEVEDGGRSRSQHSQLGRSSRAIVASPFKSAEGGGAALLPRSHCLRRAPPHKPATARAPARSLRSSSSRLRTASLCSA
jgi:hypothetical protein